MNILKSILLGLVQGLTEFLPVSSSGHLAIFGKILGTNLDSEIYFNVLLHLGTLIAIIIVFHEDIWHMIQEFFQMLLIIFANFIVFSIPTPVRLIASSSTICLKSSNTKSV